MVFDFNKQRLTIVVYIYQDPIVSWEFTQRREVVEGRRIYRDVFIDKFLASRDTVKRIKQEFGHSVQVTLVEKNLQSDQTLNITADADTIDNPELNGYSKEVLEHLISKP